MTSQTQGARHAADDQTRMTLRLPADLADTLRTFVFLTRDSANSVIVTALERYLATEGRDRMVEASTRETISRYGEVLEKLGHN